MIGTSPKPITPRVPRSTATPAVQALLSKTARPEKRIARVSRTAGGSQLGLAPTGSLAGY